MRPVFRKLFTRQTFGLCNLVFVVGKNEVFPSAVDIYLIAERRAVHRRTLYVPAGAALAPGRLPAYLALFRRFPERKVGGVSLINVVVHPHAVEHIFNRPVGKTAVSFKAVHRKVNVAVLCGIGVSAVYELLNKVDYISDIFCSFEPKRRLADVELRHNFIYFFNHIGGVLVRRYARFPRFCDNLIVDVGIIARISDIITLFFKEFAHYVVNERLIAVTYVRLARNGYSARIHFDLTLFQGNEFFLRARERIINFHFLFPSTCVQVLRFCFRARTSAL